MHVSIVIASLLSVSAALIIPFDPPTNGTNTTTPTSIVYDFPDTSTRPKASRPNVCEDSCDIYYKKCVDRTCIARSIQNNEVEFKSCKQNCKSDTCRFGEGAQFCGAFCGYRSGNCGNFGGNPVQSLPAIY